MKIKAIALGTLTDLVLSLICALPVGILGAILHRAHGSKATFETFLHSNMLLMLLSLFVGLVAVCVGGGVTAYVAKEKRVWNAFLMGVVTSLIGILFSLSLPIWFNIAS